MKNFILKLITAIALTVCGLSAFSLDAGSWIPTITLVASSAWLIPFGLANGWFEIRYERRDR